MVVGSNPTFVIDNFYIKMKFKKINPITPGTRHQIRIKKSLLIKNVKYFKHLIKKTHRFKGRSSITGRITVWQRGGGCKRKFRITNLSLKNQKSIVIGIGYDPNKTTFLSFNYDFVSKKFFFLPAPNLLTSGSLSFNNNELFDIKLGFRTIIKNIPAGSAISNLTNTNNTKIQYARAAGTVCKIIQKFDTYSSVELPSGNIVKVNNNTFATIGENSNPQYNLICWGKAGTSRLRGFRPNVRGIAMNPVDHPHGGRTNSGFVKVTPWGIPTKTKLKRRKKHF